MAVKLKPLNEQVIVMTGATSRIGLTTARAAAENGVRMVLVARNEQALQHLELELRNARAQLVVVAADVGKRYDVRRVAETAVSEFGGIDTWINNAGVSIRGRLEEVADEDSRKLFDTTFWGQVYGSMEAVRHLKKRGGAIINVGSLASDRAFPLQGMYCAAKHAVKGFTDTLRLELEEECAPISLTLIKPAGMDAPFVEQAKNYLPEEPRVPDVEYTAEEVAGAILHAATHPVRDVYVGTPGERPNTPENPAPRLIHHSMEPAMFDQQYITRSQPR